MRDAHYLKERKNMIQFYFLSIVFNAAAGYCLITAGEEGTMEPSLRSSLQNETFHLILGILATVTGLLKLLSAVQGDVPVLGDLLPALVGFATGFILLFDYYRSRTTIVSALSERLEGLLSKNKKWIGFLSLAVAGLHFLFPTVLFL
ncbi:MAG: hypothetical protein LBP71_02740 [Spirochaetaceae bacterium]|jgi:hypothetical protein|nr:hypothetical protein [Spirochaetaceae bacterium]